MTIRIVHRPARTTLPEQASEAAQLDAPPQLATGGGTNLLALVPMLGAATSVTVMMLFRGSSLAGIGAIMMVATVLASVVLLFSQRGKSTRQRAAKRRLYLDYLRRRRQDFEAEEHRARASANAAHPPASRLVENVVNDPHRLWERRRTSPDFLMTRFGTGAVPRRSITVQDSGDAVERPDTFMLSEAEQLRQRFMSTPDIPLTLPLGSVSDVSIVGDRAAALMVCRSLLGQLAAAHSPEDVELAIVAGERQLDDWDWAKWLPHLQETGGNVRQAASFQELAPLLRSSLDARAAALTSAARNFQLLPADALPRLVVISDLPGHNATPLPGVPAGLDLNRLAITRIHLLTEQQHEPERVDLRLTVSSDALTVEATATGEMVTGIADEVPPEVADGLARALAPLRLSEMSHEFGEHKSSRSYAEALGLTEYTAEAMLRLWHTDRGPDFLRVAIGEDDDGAPVHLDLKEPAQQGMGPHGLCVGATGSGKSELLRTIVLSLIATHSPQDLNMVLVDYKGGATFAPFEDAPHVSGLVTNLVSDASLVDRIHSSLSGEVKRRQELLKHGGDFAHINDYRLARERTPGNPALQEPLPYLFVCIDEFGELLTARSDFIDLLLSIGRIGRSIGIHLLLASQKVESGMLRGLDTYLAYRIALHTNSESESRTIIDVPDAYHLPSTPGHGILKVDTTVFKRFRAAYVSGALPSKDDDGGAPAEEAVPVTLFKLGAQPPLPVLQGAGPAGGAVSPDGSSVAIQPETHSSDGSGDRPTILSAVVGFASAQPRMTPPVWLPPLPAAVSLHGTGAALNLTSTGPRLAQPRYLAPAVGILDDPARQWQGPWHLDFTARGGNLAVIGAPQSGRSTALRTVAAALALSHSVSDVNLYAVDLLGNALAGLADLPHCAGVAGRGNRELLRRTIEEVQGLLNIRQTAFDANRLDTVQAMRSARGKGRLEELSCTDVFLLIDGFGSLSSEFQEIEDAVHDIMTRGSSLGIHVVVSVRNWSEVRMTRQSLLGNRIELHIADPADSLDRRLASTLGPNRPGRALTMDRTIGQFALPSLAEAPDAGNSAAELGELTHALRQFSDRTAPPVRVLPPLVRLPAGAPVSGTVALGIREHDAETEHLDLFGSDRGAVIFGDPETGRTNLLKTVATQLIATHEPGQLAFAVFDPRQQLQNFIPDEYLGEYASNGLRAAQLADFVAGQVRERLGDGTGAPVKSPRIVLLVDDYDILAATGSQPLRPLAGYLPSGSDVGLFALVTGRISGAALTVHDPFVAGLRAAGAPVVMFSGDRSEGVIANGERPMPLVTGRARILRPGRHATVLQTFHHDSEAALP